MSQGGVEVLLRLIIKLETSELDGNCLFASVGSYCQKIMDIAYNRYMFTVVNHSIGFSRASNVSTKVSHSVSGQTR